MENEFKVAVGAILGLALAALMICGVLAFVGLVIIISQKSVLLGAFATIALVIGAISGAVFIPRML